MPLHILMPRGLCQQPKMKVAKKIDRSRRWLILASNIFKEDLGTRIKKIVIPDQPIYWRRSGIQRNMDYVSLLGFGMTIVYADSRGQKSV